MSKWSYRSGLYQGTLILIVLVFFVYALAFSVPTWYGNAAGYKGLWLACIGSDDNFDNCTKVAFGDDNSDWMDAVRGVWVGGAFFYLLAVLYGLVENCCVDERSKDYGITGIFTLLAGMCGAAGIILVAVNTADEDTMDTYFWGFILACASSGLALILAIVLLLTKGLVIHGEKEPRSSRTADYVFAHKQGSPYSSEYTNQGFTRDDVPLANGVTYQHNPHPAPYSMYRGMDTGPGPYNTNSLQRSGQHNGMGYNPYDMNRPNQRYSVAESADLSNGYTNELIQAEHSLSRSQVGGRSGLDYPSRGGDYGRSSDYGRQDYYMNGGGRY